ncbi:MAG: DUF1836 domain-containing protein [Lachnospiraceae bacterium]|nr:DUF1836 domain-containing protein [Lachnospiraceae bacterium]
MSSNTSDYLRSMLDKIKNIDYIKPEDIPNIELYMDQVTTFMDEHLASTKRYDSDKILTKTMINNYAKNDLLPPPVKKKYSKEHMLLLIFIYYFKNILSITDIQNLLTPLTEKYFNASEGMNLQDIYNEVFGFEKEQADRLVNDILEEYKKAFTSFSDAPDEDKEFLHLFSFICMLSFDVYVKKLLIEKLVDDIVPPQTESKKDKAK